MIMILEIAAVSKMVYSHGVHHYLLVGSMCVRVFERERERGREREKHLSLYRASFLRFC